MVHSAWCTMVVITLVCGLFVDTVEGTVSKNKTATSTTGTKSGNGTDYKPGNGTSEKTVLQATSPKVGEIALRYRKWRPALDGIDSPGAEATPDTEQRLCRKSSDCILKHSCISGRCADPCANLCGKNAMCDISQHHASCSCIAKYIGNPFKKCKFLSVASTKSSHTKKKKRKTRERKLFFAIKKQKTWPEALAHCRAIDMDLAVIENKKQQAEVERLIDDPNLTETLWLGGTSLGKQGSYIWIANGQAVKYSNWRRGEPNGALANCFGVSPDDNKWVAFQCSAPKIFLCEYKMN